MAQAPPLTPSRDHDKQQRQEGPLERSASTSAQKAQHGLGQMRRAPIRPPLITDAVGRHRRVKAVCPGRQRPSRDAAESLSTGSRRRLAPSTSGPVAVGGTGYPAPLPTRHRPILRGRTRARRGRPDMMNPASARTRRRLGDQETCANGGHRLTPAAGLHPMPLSSEPSAGIVWRPERPVGDSHLSAWALSGLLIHCGRCPPHLDGARCTRSGPQRGLYADRCVTIVTSVYARLRRVVGG